MGNCATGMQSVFRRKPTDSQTQLGRMTPCPCCGNAFPSSTTYSAFNSHIDGCRISHRNHPVAQNQISFVNTERVQQNVASPAPKESDSNLEYFWSKVPVLLTPREFEEESQNNPNRKSSVTSVSSQTSRPKYRWEKRSYSKSDIHSESLKKLSATEVMKLPFEKKQIWLRNKCEMRRIPWIDGADWIKVHPDNILLNSLNEIQHCDMHREVKIEIIGDKVNDAGGLLREWIHLCMKEIFHPNTGMFLAAETNDATYKINKDADHDEHILDCFRLLGKIIGKAIFERITMNACFDRSIINYILGRQTSLEDIFFYDNQLYNSFVSLSENKLGEDDFIDVFAVYKNLPNGKVQTIELIPNGEEETVNESNKMLYIQKKIQYLCVDSVKVFLDAMSSEIYNIVPKAELSVFEPHELEMILLGVPFIDLEEWRTHTEYTGYSSNHRTVSHFWQIMGEFNQEQLSKFLQYCTGSARIPVEGFKKLESNRGNYSKFNLRQVAFEKTNPYPKAHTCFNRLELPDYPTIDAMRTYMKAIVTSDLEGVYGLD